MRTALVGHSGFVGSNISNQFAFDDYFNSKNIEAFGKGTYDLVVCAAAPAEKWRANQNPKEDLAIIESLAATLVSANVKSFVLISTVDVYATPTNIDETTVIDIRTVPPYGRHRLMLETILKHRFDEIYIIRLPGLFGEGLKKNVLFDMLCGNLLEKINLESTFQWYPISRIWQDIQVVLENRLHLVNFAVEPIKTKVIHDLFFANVGVGMAPLERVNYDMRSIYAKYFKSRSDGYMLSAELVLKEMASWLESPGVVVNV